MKLKMLALVFVLTTASSAFAQFFPARANAVVLPLSVTVEIFNPYYEPISCRGQIIGQTYQGQVFAQPFFDGFIPAGQFRTAAIFTNQFAPFVFGRADIHCQFVRYYY